MSIRAYDGTATDYGAGAGIRIKIGADGSGFFSGAIVAASVTAAWFKGDVAATNVPALPPTSYTGFLLDPANGLRFFSSGTLTAQFQGSGVTILAGTIAGPTIESPDINVGSGSTNSGLKISSGVLSLYTLGTNYQFDIYYWTGSAWTQSVRYVGGTFFSAEIQPGSGYSFTHKQSFTTGGYAGHAFEKVTALNATGISTDYTGLVMFGGSTGAIGADFFAGDGTVRTSGGGSQISRRCDLRWRNYVAVNCNPTGTGVSYPQRYVNAPTSITITLAPTTTDALNGGAKTVEFISEFGFHFYINGQAAVIADGVTRNLWTAAGGS